MGNPPAQTPIVIVKAGMEVVFSAECQAALISCGVDPAKFGTYKDRQTDEKAARDDINTGHGDKYHRTDAALTEHGSEKWLEANSQSGHLMQNAFAQGAGGRGDPCSNVRPNPANPADHHPPAECHGGFYGYDMDRAACMDHFGGSTVKGTPHYEITRREAEFAQQLPPGSQVSQAQMEQSVRGTAEIAVLGPQARVADPADLAAAKVQTQRFQDRQKQQAGALQQSPPPAPDMSQPGSVAHATGPAAGRPAQSGEARPHSDEQQKAIDCITAAWKASLDQMRKDAIEHNSTAGKERSKQLAAHNAANPPGVASYHDIPEPHRSECDKKVDAAVEARQKELRDANAHGAGKAGDPPTKDDCREYQANWLHQYQQSHGGALPPVMGRVPGAERTTDPAATNARTGTDL